MIQTLSDALAEHGYDELTEVQRAVTAPELQDADLLVSAQTGSGKTVGFGLAIGHTLLGDADQMPPAAAPLALVVAPTRELALQVMRELTWLYAKAGARVISCVGGMDMRDERRALDRGAHIVVGTPGRLRDHIQRGSFDMSGLRAIVLDEADEMLDLGFREDLEFMLGEAPADRRTLMFSATVPKMIATLAKKYQRDAVRVTTLTGTKQHSDIAYQALRVSQADAENAIINVLRYHDAQNALVFANTRLTVNRLTARFANRGFAVVSLSGELSQNERTHALQAMRDGRARVCVATDVAARGIDLPNLELVIHADLPTNPEVLLHRSGRTGRAGRKGISALIVPPRATGKADRLLKMAKIEAEWTTAPTAEEIIVRDEERLLADPIWDEELTERQQAFAEKLLALHAPDKIAAAYLRMHLRRQSAPEDLSAPDTSAPAPAAREHKPFGPSVWFALSVGANDRAEARWLLPLLCRAGNLGKDAIGAIRVQPSETFVELAAGSVDGFISALGPEGELEEGVKARRLDTAPDMDRPRAASPRPGSAARHPTERPTGPRENPRAPRDDKPRAAEAPAPRPIPDAVPSPEKRRFEAPRPSARPDPRAPGAAPAWKGKRPAEGSASAPRAPRPDRAPYDAEARGKKPFAGKPSRSAPAQKPARSSADAADTSKRFERPGKPAKPAKPGSAGPKGDARKPRHDKGSAPPRRDKR